MHLTDNLLTGGGFTKIEFSFFFFYSTQEMGEWFQGNRFSTNQQNASYHCRHNTTYIEISNHHQPKTISFTVKEPKVAQNISYKENQPD